MTMEEKERFRLGKYEFVYISFLEDNIEDVMNVLRDLYSQYLDVKIVAVRFSRNYVQTILSMIRNEFSIEPDGVAEIYITHPQIQSPIYSFIEVETLGSYYVFYQCTSYAAFGVRLAFLKSYVSLGMLPQIPFTVVIAVKLSESIIDSLLDHKIPVIQLFPEKDRRLVFELNSTDDSSTISLFKKIVIERDLTSLYYLLKTNKIKSLHKVFILRYAYLYGDEKMKIELDNYVPSSEEEYMEQQAISELDAKYVNYLSPEQIRALDEKRIAALSPQQIAALTPQQIAAIPYEKFILLPDNIKQKLIITLLNSDLSDKTLTKIVDVLLKNKKIRELLFRKIQKS